jgi:hypothetical protein
MKEDNLMWHDFTPNTTTILPESAQRFIEKRDVSKSGYGNIVQAYFRGDINTTEDWILVTDDGSWFKHRAKYMVWHKKYILARWSDNSLEILLDALMSDKTPPRDPDYET